MKTFDFLGYFKLLATAHLSIAHTENDNHFQRIASVFDLTEFLTNYASITGFQLLCVDQEAGKLVDNHSANVLTDTFYSFYLLHPVKIGDPADKQAVLASTKIVFNDILSKLRFDQVKGFNGLKDVNLNSVNYSVAGPFGHNWYGYQCTFTTLNPLNLVIDQGQWNMNDLPNVP